MAKPLNTEPGPGEVVFIVGADKERFIALKGLFIISSPIFRELLEENKEKNEIELLDIDAAAFKIALSHIEGNDVKSKINKENMCNVLFISTNYLLQKLTKLTVKFVKKSFDKTNIYDLYQFAENKNDDYLRKLLWRWLGRKSTKTTEPIITKIFQSLSSKQIAELLQKDYISIREERIFTQCLNWLRKQYQSKGNKTDTIMGSPRDMMADFLKYIRFPVMGNKFLSNDVYFAGILTDKELINIFRAKTLKDKTLTVYNLKKRPRYAVSEDYMDESDEDMDDIENDSDNEFDDINMENASDDEEEKVDYTDITDKIKPILNSGECNGYPMTNMYSDGGSYWCSNALGSNVECWVMFDCGEYEINKIDIKFQVSYASTIVKIYSCKNKRSSRINWDKITKKINMPRGAQVNELKIRRDDQCRYLMIQFEDWTNGYVGVERIHFYQNSDE